MGAEGDLGVVHLGMRAVSGPLGWWLTWLLIRHWGGGCGRSVGRVLEAGVRKEWRVCAGLGGMSGTAPTCRLTQWPCHSEEGKSLEA